MTRLVFLALVVGLSACAPDPAPDAAPVPPTPPEVAPVALAEVLPDSLRGRARQSLDQSRDAALGAEIERVQAVYGDVVVSVTDFKTADMTEMMGYGWALAPDAERIMGHPASRVTLADSASVQLVIGERHLVEAAAPSEADALAALRYLDLSVLD